MQLVAFSPGTVTLTLRPEETPAFDLTVNPGPAITLSTENRQLVLEVGSPGPAATVSVGSTTTLSPGSSATVTNSGTGLAAILNFGIPRGEHGIQGIQGIPGPAGTSGVVYATSPLSYNSGTQTISIDLSAYATQSFVTSQGYITTSALAPYLTSALAASTYYPLTNPAGYITSSALSPYLLSSTAASTYQTLAGMSSYAPLASPTFTGDPKAPTPATSDWDTSIATTAYVKNQGYATTTALNYNLGFYLPKAGGNMDASATVQYSDGTYDSQIAGWGFGVELTASPSENASICFNAVTVQDSLGSMQMTATGLTFPDSTVMTTAAAGGVGYTSPCLTYAGSNITAIDLSSGSLTANYVYGGDLVRASNLTLTSGNGGVLTFEDNTTQSTAFPGYTGTSAQYIAGDGSLITFPTLSSADKLTAIVSNQTGATLTAGTVVYINGTHGNLPTVAKAQANSEATSSGTYGLVQANIANNDSGYIVLAGVIENLALHAYADGDKLYLSPTVAGEYTITKPSAPNHMVFIGVVTRAHPTLGKIQLRIANGFELEELHNVAAQTPSNNDLLVYESATSLWKNKSFATLGLLTTSAAASTYAPLASPVFTGNPTAPTPATGDNDTSIATTAFVKAQGYITSSALSPYLQSATAASTYYLQTNPAGYITSAGLSGYALQNGFTAFSVTGASIKSLDGSDNFAALDQGVLNFGNGSTPSGLSVSGTGITFADSTVQTTAAVAGISDAPMDSQTYGRNNGAWEIGRAHV